MNTISKDTIQIPASVRLLLIIAVILVFLAFLFGRIVPPGSMGVRQITLRLPFGPEPGINPNALSPGLHWNIPFYSRVILVPQGIRLLHLSRSATGAIGDAVEVQTTDGSSVVCDISLVNRFYDKPGEIEFNGKKIKHGGPADLLQGLGPSELQWNNTIRRDAVDELRKALASLSTSQFYDPHKREAQLNEAFVNLNQKLGPRGIRIDSVLLRRYTYSEERIDRAIFAKNLQDQEERLNKAASDLAEAKAKLEQTSAELDAQIKTLSVQGENKASVLRSEGDLFNARKKADADLLIAKAEAEVARLRGEIYANTPGAGNYIAMETAPLLGSLGGGVVDNIDPFDLSIWMQKLGVKEGK